jgi:hypothetical protein
MELSWRFSNMAFPHSNTDNMAEFLSYMLPNNWLIAGTLFHQVCMYWPMLYAWICYMDLNMYGQLSLQEGLQVVYVFNLMNEVDNDSKE